MITTTYDYSSGSGFVYNISDIGFSGGYASLLPINVPGETFTPILANSTYNSSLLTYSAGSLKQLDQRPSTATFYAAWTSQLNANWSGAGNGSLIVTAFAGAAIATGVLNLIGSGKYVSFSPVNNADNFQIGTIEFDYIPNYSGPPGAQQNIISIAAANELANAIEISHNTSDGLFVIMNDHNNTMAVSANYTISMTASTVYTMILNYNCNTGVISLSINGSTVINTTVSPFTRTGTAITLGYIGATTAGAPSTGNNFSINNLSFYSSVLTPSSPVLSPTIYVNATANLPEFTYAGLHNLLAWTALSITDSNAPAYTFNGLYWNSSAWVSSNGTYAQATTAATAIANITTLPASNTLQVNAIYQAAAVQASLSAMTVTYTGQIYPTDPTIASNMSLTMDQLSAFTDVESASGSDGIGWFLLIGTVNYWFNGSSWVTTNKTFAQSNTAAQINSNASTLPITLGAYVTPYAILHSATGLTTPSLTSLTLTYDYFGPPPMGPDKCTVFGYLLDESGNPVVGATMTVKNPTTFINQGIVEVQGLKNVVTDSIGYFSFTLNETTTVNEKLQWSVVYPFTGVASNIFSFGSTLIPDIPEVNFSTLTFTPS